MDIRALAVGGVVIIKGMQYEPFCKNKKMELSRKLLFAEQDFIDTQQVLGFKHHTILQAVKHVWQHHYVKTMLVLATRMTAPVMLFMHHSLIQVGLNETTLFMGATCCVP